MDIEIVLIAENLASDHGSDMFTEIREAIETTQTQQVDVVLDADQGHCKFARRVWRHRMPKDTPFGAVRICWYKKEKVMYQKDRSGRTVFLGDQQTEPNFLRVDVWNGEGWDSYDSSVNHDVYLKEVWAHQPGQVYQNLGHDVVNCFNTWKIEHAELLRQRLATLESE